MYPLSPKFLPWWPSKAGKWVVVFQLCTKSELGSIQLSKWMAWISMVYPFGTSLGLWTMKFYGCMGWQEGAVLESNGRTCGYCGLLPKWSYKIIGIGTYNYLRTIHIDFPKVLKFFEFVSEPKMFSSVTDWIDSLEQVYHPVSMPHLLSVTI